MSWDENLFQYFFKKLKTAQKKVMTTVPEVWQPELEVIASSLWGGEMLIRFDSTLEGLDQSVLILPKQVKLELSLPALREFILLRILYIYFATQILETNASANQTFDDWLLQNYPGAQEMMLRFMQSSPMSGDLLGLVTADLGTFVPSLAIPEIGSLETAQGQRENRRLQKKVDTAAKPKLVTLDEQQENPLVHSFEKVHTIENYQGGNRPAEDAGDLLLEEEALQELRLDAVTRSQEQVSGYVQSDAVLETGEDCDAVQGSLSVDEKMYTYPEWSHKKSCYLKDWVTVYERTAQTHEEEPLGFDSAGVDDFVMNETPVWTRAQESGSEIDLPATIDWMTTPASARDGTPRIYMQKHPHDLDTAFLFLLDQSYSTDTWNPEGRVFDIFQECIISVQSLFVEDEEFLAVAAFNSETRHRVNFNYVKRFDEKLNQIGSRLMGLKPQCYTRIGPALRHAGEQIAKHIARNKIVVLLSDCKPTDYDRYEGQHGFADVRRAILELEDVGVTTLVFTCHPQALGWISDLFQQSQIRVFRDATEFQNLFFPLIQTQRK